MTRVTKYEMQQHLDRLAGELEASRLEVAKLRTQLEMKSSDGQMELAWRAGCFALLGHTVTVKDGDVLIKERRT